MKMSLGDPTCCSFILITRCSLAGEHKGIVRSCKEGLLLHSCTDHSNNPMLSLSHSHSFLAINSSKFSDYLLFWGGTKHFVYSSCKQPISVNLCPLQCSDCLQHCCCLSVFINSTSLTKQKHLDANIAVGE